MYALLLPQSEKGIKKSGYPVTCHFSMFIEPKGDADRTGCAEWTWGNFQSYSLALGYGTIMGAVMWERDL